MSYIGRVKSILGIGDSDKRYHSEDSVNDPEEVSDPHTWRDESRRGIIQRARDRPRTTATYLLILGVALAIGFIYSRRFFPDLYQNEAVRAIAKYTLIIGLSLFIGMWIQRQIFRGIDQLVLDFPEKGVRRWHCELDTDSEGNPIATLYKGFGLLGLFPRELKKGDLSNEWARLWSKNNATADEAAIVRLWESLANEAETATGTVAVQQTAELTPDPHGRESDLVAQPPEMADAETVAKVNEELRRKTNQLSNAKAERDIARDQRDEAIRQAKTRREEFLDQEIDRMTDLLGALPQVMGRMNEGSETLQPEPKTGPMEDRVQEEMNDE